jgi:hypothetical protein
MFWDLLRHMQGGPGVIKSLLHHSGLSEGGNIGSLMQWYSTFYVRVPPEKNGAPISNVLTSGSPMANPKSGPDYSVFSMK